MASESDIKAAVAAADAAKVESLLTEGAPADAAVLGEALVRLVRASTEHDNDSPFDSMFTDAMLGALRQGGLQITVDSTQAAALGDALNTAIVLLKHCPAAADYGETFGGPLMRAADADSEASGLAWLELLVANGADLHGAGAKTSWGTPLTKAAKHGHCRMGERLLELGCHVDGLDKEGRAVSSFGSPLVTASEENRLDFARLLLARGADPNLLGQFTGPVHTAAKKGHMDMMKLLLEAGADPEKTPDQGGTALFQAIEAGQTEAALHLLDNGLCRLLTNSPSGTCVHAAAKCKSDDMATLILDRVAAECAGDEAALRAALNQAADTWSFDLDPLSDAVRAGLPQRVDMLLARGADPNTMPPKGGRGPALVHLQLRSTARAEFHAMLKALLAAGANPNLRGSWGGQLHELAKTTQPQLRQDVSTGISALLAAKADPNLEDDWGRTPLWMALDEKQWDAAEQLLGCAATSVACPKRAAKNESTPWTLLAERLADGGLEAAEAERVVAVGRLMLARTASPAELLPAADTLQKVDAAGPCAALLPELAPMLAEATRLQAEQAAEEERQQREREAEEQRKKEAQAKAAEEEKQRAEERKRQEAERAAAGVGGLGISAGTIFQIVVGVGSFLWWLSSRKQE